MRRWFVVLVALLALAGCSHSDDDNGPIMPGDGEDQMTFSDEQDPRFAGPEPLEYSAGVARQYGILWKPVSDSDGKLVILLARSWGKPTVQVLTMRRRAIETGRFVYFSNPNRATYRFSRPGRAFPSPCILRVGSKLFKVPNPSRRYE